MDFIDEELQSEWVEDFAGQGSNLTSTSELHGFQKEFVNVGISISVCSITLELLISWATVKAFRLEKSLFCRWDSTKVMQT